MIIENALIHTYAFAITGIFAFVLVFALAKYIIRALGIMPGTRFLRRIFVYPLYSKDKSKESTLYILLRIFLIFLFSRAMIWLIGYAGCLYKGTDWYYLNFQSDIWSRWDASHYLGIAENGYQTVGDARLHIVFYPLYPYLVRFFSLGILPVNLSAYIVSNVCLILSAFYLYLLSKNTYGKKEAQTAVLFFMFSPAAVFFSIPYTESLFFLLTIMSAYFSRKRRFCLAIVFASLSAFTRLPGVVSAVFVFFEMIRSESKRFKRENLRIASRAFAKTASVRFLTCVLILSGFAAYLIVNKVVTGSAFTFLKYQKEHWGQETGTLFNTASYTITYAFRPFVDWYRTGVYIPQTVILAVVLIVFLISMRKAHPADLAYGVVYFYITVIPTMLISGPRYMSAMYSLYPLLAVISKRNLFFRILVFILWGCMFIYGSYMYAVEGTFL